MEKNILSILAILAILAVAGGLGAEEILPGKSGAALVQGLRSQYQPTRSLSYREARQNMFGQIDNYGGRVVLMYTGESYSTNTIPPEREVNTEHTWPQSRFEDSVGRGRMKSDLHHLFPTSNSVNSRRGNNAFGDIPDERTQFWYRSPLAQQQIPNDDRDSYSEATDGEFEPREDHKGNIARALLYFYTVYGDQNIEVEWFKPQVPTLLKWHELDAADAREIERTQRIAAVQGNRNPYVLDATLAKRAFGGQVPVVASHEDSAMVLRRTSAAEVTPAEPIEPREVRPADEAVLLAGNKLRIGAWNIENLGTRSADSNADDQEPEALAEYIHSSQVSLLALEEIHDDEQDSSETPGRAPWKNKILDRTMAELEERSGHRWKYVLTAPGPANIRQQLTGVAWDTEVVELIGREPVSVPGGEVDGADVWNRRPEAFHFSTGEGQTDIAIIPLHMKSNNTVNGRNVGLATRVQEAQQLKAQLQSLTEALQGEKDIVLLGDTNMLHGETTAAVQWGGKFRDLNTRELYTYIKPFRNQQFPPFDRIFVPLGQPEFNGAAQTVHGPYGADREARKQWRENHLETRSDHLLIWADISITADDD